jgi:putative transposase
VSYVLQHIKQLVYICFHLLQRRFLRGTPPLPTSLLLGTIRDLARGKAELVAENALLRQQLMILRRQIKRPTYKKSDRILLVLLARAVRAWRQALFLVQPETLLRWHRKGFRLFWKHKSRPKLTRAKVAAETIALIKEMARNNRLWGAERIRGELLKLEIHVCKRTIQKYMRHACKPRATGQNWRTFLRNHAEGIWACDFLQVSDLFFRSLFAFFIIELKSRKVLHVGVTRFPTDTWTAQQLREATPYGQTTKYLIRDRDSKFGPCADSCRSNEWHRDSQNTLSCTSRQCDLRTLSRECPARVPRSSVNPAREAATSCPASLCEVFQSGTTTSRHPAAGSGRRRHPHCVRSA